MPLSRMVRILIPKHVYNEHRIKLVERMSDLQSRSYRNEPGLISTFRMLGLTDWSFLEGYLANEDRLHTAAGRLSDNYRLISIEMDEIPTWIIDDGDDPVTVPY